MWETQLTQLGLRDANAQTQTQRRNADATQNADTNANADADATQNAASTRAQDAGAELPAEHAEQATTTGQ